MVDSAWEAYKSDLDVYKSAIRKAKRFDWIRFCNEIDSTSEASRLRKILSKANTNIAALKTQDGKWTESSLETLELLLGTHFPTGTDFSERMYYSGDLPIQLIEKITSKEKTIWAIDSFKPFKSSGPDGIFPAQLQHSIGYILPWLKAIFAGCLKIKYIPQCWLRST